jgi:hypothetical protein
VVAKLMGNISFEKARKPLPALCLASLQSVSQEDQDILAAQVDSSRRPRRWTSSRRACLWALPS